MPLIVATNLLGNAVNRTFGRSQDEFGVAIARLSSGLRINSARDDAAGLAIAGRLTSQVRGTSQAARNANEAISLAQTVEGALSSTTSNLQRMRELAVQAANGTNSAADRAALNTEVRQLIAEVDRIASQTQFNGLKLLDGSFGVMQVQVGADAGQTIAMAAPQSARANALGMYQGMQYSYAGGQEASNTAYVLAVSISTGPTIYLGTVPIDMKAQADVINAAGIPGLTAKAFDTFVTAGVSVAAATNTGTATLTLNGIAISLAGASGGGQLASNRSTAVAAINARSAVTGVVARDTGAGVSLSADDGRNIVTSYSAGSFSGSGMADFGLSAAGIRSGHQLVDYVAPPGVTGNISFYLNGSSAGNVFPIQALGTAVEAIDVSSITGANVALASLDLALNSISSVRAAFGALQNRLASTTERLQLTSDNLEAARSRIQDADFAMETATLTRSQVLQESAIAMLAQANQSADNVRQLLR